MIEGKGRGIIVRNMDTGAIEKHGAHAVVLAMGCNASAIWRAHKRGALFANPSWTQMHPTSLPQSGEYQSKLTLMSESWRNDGRIWVPKNKDEQRAANDIPESERDYTWNTVIQHLAIFARAILPRERPRKGSTPAMEWDRSRMPSIWIFPEQSANKGKRRLWKSTSTYFECMKRSPASAPKVNQCAFRRLPTFPWGQFVVDYELMTNVPGLYAVGEANFADHGANRLGANSLLQACVDRYFIAPYTIPNYLADEIKSGPVEVKHSAFVAAEEAVMSQVQHLLDIQGTLPADHFYKALGRILYDKCGLSRSRVGLEQAMASIRTLREQFHNELRVPGGPQMNSELEKAGRVSDYLEVGELKCYDALTREESCGAHFREPRIASQ